MFHGLHFFLDRGIRRAHPRCFLPGPGFCKQGLHRNHLPSKLFFWVHCIPICIHLQFYSACGQLAALKHVAICDESLTIQRG